MSEIGGVSVFLAFAAGFVSFISPCVLPLVPVYLANMAGVISTSSVTDARVSRTLPHALAFVLGFSLVFILIGALLGLLGAQIKSQINLVSRIMGVFVIVMGLHMTGFVRLPFLNRVLKPTFDPNTRLGYGRSFLLGNGFAVGWTPCIGPTLGAILTLGISTGQVTASAFLLAIYSLGLGIPFLFVGAAAGWGTGLLKKLTPHMRLVEILSGALLVVAGILLTTNTLTRFNQYFQSSGLGSRI